MISVSKTLNFRSFCSYLKFINMHCPLPSFSDCDSNNVCPDIKECSLCLNGGTCQDVIDDYSCLCMSGYTGVHCETNINECQGIDCKVSHMSFNWLLYIVSSFAHNYTVVALEHWTLVQDVAVIIGLFSKGDRQLAQCLSLTRVIPPPPAGVWIDTSVLMGLAESSGEDR